MTRRPSPKPEPEVDPRIRARLMQLLPRPAQLPAMGSEVLLEGSVKFAEIILLYVTARNVTVGSPEELGALAREATLWYYGVKP